MTDATIQAEVIDMTKYILIAALLLSSMLQAENGNVSYIQYMENEGIILASDTQEKLTAQVNYPLYPGDGVETQRLGRMEIALSDGNLLWLDRATAAEMRGLAQTDGFSDQRTYVFVKDGQAALEALRSPDKGGEPVLGFANGDFYAYGAGLYALELRGRQSFVRVLSGRGELVTDRGSVLLQAGEEAIAYEDGYVDRRRLRNGDDTFAQWIEDRRTRRLRSKSAEYVGEQYASYSYQLDDYGSWVYMSSISMYAWRPVVAVGWQPFYHGGWSWTRHGWFWVGGEPWGYMTYHYGRWVWDPAFGWVWVPGSYWSPAWVNWYWDAAYIGWSPMGYFDYWWFLGWPGSGFWGGHDPHCWHHHCYHNSWGHVDFRLLDHRPFVFVEARGFGQPQRFVAGVDFKGRLESKGVIRALTLPLKIGDLGNPLPVLNQARLEAKEDLTPLFKPEPKLTAEARTILNNDRVEVVPSTPRVAQPERTAKPGVSAVPSSGKESGRGLTPRRPVEVHRSTPRVQAEPRVQREGTPSVRDRSAEPETHRIKGRETTPSREPVHPTVDRSEPARPSAPESSKGTSDHSVSPKTPEPSTPETTPEKNAYYESPGGELSRTPVRPREARYGRDGDDQRVPSSADSLRDDDSNTYTRTRTAIQPRSVSYYESSTSPSRDSDSTYSAGSRTLVTPSHESSSQPEYQPSYFYSTARSEVQPAYSSYRSEARPSYSPSSSQGSASHSSSSSGYSRGSISSSHSVSPSHTSSTIHSSSSSSNSSSSSGKAKK
jgi:hypothetical protein